MDKGNEIGNGLDFLKIKVGIYLYRGATFFGAFFCMLMIYPFWLNYEYVGTVIIILLCLTFILLTIFMGKLAYVFHLPTYHLLVYQDKIIYAKGKKPLMFEIEKIKYEFHSVWEDLFSPSQLVISTDDDKYYFAITRKQFNAMERFLKNKI